MPEPAKKSQGHILKEAREAKGLTLEAVHESTKIPLDVLKAIEEGYTVRTVSAFYLRGFLKMYANYVGVNPAQIGEERPKENVVLARERESENAHTEPVLSDEQKQFLVKILALALAVFVVVKMGGCVVGKWKSSRQAKKAEATQAQPAQGPAPTEEPKSAKSEAKSEAKKEKPEQKNQAAVQPIAPQVKPKPAAQPVQPKPQAQTQAGAAPAVPTPTITKKVSVTVKARKKAWLQVKVDGNLVFQSTLNEGVTETWQADELIDIAGRNIFYLDFEVNGQVLGSLGRSDRNARRVIVTQDGLTVKQ